MSPGRRTFLESLAAGAAGLTAADLFDPREALAQAGSHWDLSWVGRIKGKHRAVFDVPEVEDGYGVWRAIIWKRQYSQVFDIPESAMTSVLILRHNGTALALNQTFWERYRVADDHPVKDPATQEPTRRNPVVERTGAHAFAAPYTDFTLEQFMASGGITLVCALAFHDCVARVARRDGVNEQEAEHRARTMLVPGVIMQPSGVFGAVLAQEQGCRYVRSS